MYLIVTLHAPSTVNKILDISSLFHLKENIVRCRGMGAERKTHLNSFDLLTSMNAA